MVSVLEREKGAFLQYRKNIYLRGGENESGKWEQEEDKVQRERDNERYNNRGRKKVEITERDSRDNMIDIARYWEWVKDTERYWKWDRVREAER